MTASQRNYLTDSVYAAWATSRTARLAEELNVKNLILYHTEDCTFALNRQVEVIAILRSFRPIPADEFYRIARPLIM